MMDIPLQVNTQSTIQPRPANGPKRSDLNHTFSLRRMASTSMTLNPMGPMRIRKLVGKVVIIVSLRLLHTSREL